jgi:hypothetical protein
MPKDDAGRGDGFADALEALFATVVAKARTDRAFARQLAKSVGNPAKLAQAAKRSRDIAAEAPDVDVPAIFADKGAEGLRSALRPLTQRQIYALIRVHKLNPANTSKLNKTQLIEHAVRCLTREKEPRKRVFDY